MRALTPELSRAVGVGLDELLEGNRQDNEMSDPNEVVGHKTLRDESGRLYHEPLTHAEADALWEQVEREQARREALMPDEAAAIQLMMDAHTRLKDFGWNDAIYCPKDGSAFHALEAGSTGIHLCSYMGEWPKGGWWIEDCPSRPTLYRPLPSNT